MDIIKLKPSIFTVFSLILSKESFFDCLIIFFSSVQTALFNASLCLIENWYLSPTKVTTGSTL
ncbi:TPA: hypothetical protein ACKOWA_001647 [Clostridioides difficile]